MSGGPTMATEQCQASERRYALPISVAPGQALLLESRSYVSELLAGARLAFPNIRPELALPLASSQSAIPSKALPSNCRPGSYPNPSLHDSSGVVADPKVAEAGEAATLPGGCCAACHQSICDHADPVYAGVIPGERG